MTAPRRGRGRPLVFDPALRTRYLTLIAEGMPLGNAATTVGISLRLPTLTAQRDPTFATLFLTAKQAGRAVRAEAKEHGLTRYKHYGCHCGICTKAATTQRAHAPSRTTSPDRTEPQEPPPATLIPMPELKSSTSLLLLVRAS